MSALRKPHGGVSAKCRNREKRGAKYRFLLYFYGEFHFPNDKAAGIVVKTVKEYKAQTGSRMEVIFNVFKEINFELYRELLRADTIEK